MWVAVALVRAEREAGRQLDFRRLVTAGRQLLECVRVGAELGPLAVVKEPGRVRVADGERPAHGAADQR